jgi:uncharacterized membrane protein YphA (DoxX/SURF4 family)
MTNENVSQAGGAGGKKSFGRYVTTIVRLLLGLMFLGLGVMGLLNYMTPPKNTPEYILTILKALTDAGYLKVVAGTEVLAGALLLLNLFVPLALALLAPIVVGILTYHVFVQPTTIVPGVVVAVMELYLAFAYRGAFKPMLRPRVTPGAH